MFWRQQDEDDRERAGALADRLEAHIDGDTRVELWSVTLLEKIVERIERLERRGPKFPDPACPSCLYLFVRGAPPPPPCDAHKEMSR